jgi:hypothetical protein
MSEEAKAIQEASKAIGKAIDLAKCAGQFCNKLFGVGILSDILEYRRKTLSGRLEFDLLEKLLLLKKKTEENLKNKNINVTIPIPLKLGIPLIEAATVEEDETLHTKYANMLSNAIDPNFENKITRNFVSILEDMNPVDVLILDTICKEWLSLPENKKNNTLFDRSKITNALQIESKECEISLRNLIRLGLFKPGVITQTNIVVGGNSPSSYKDTELVGITELGIALYQSIK